MHTCRYRESFTTSLARSLIFGDVYGIYSDAEYIRLLRNRRESVGEVVG